MTNGRGSVSGHDYWMVVSTPHEDAAEAAFAEAVDEHLEWMLGLERAGRVLCSGPLLSGPGVRAGSGVTVLRAEGEDEAIRIAEADPFVRRGLRSFVVHRWQLLEGSFEVRLLIGADRYEWA